MEAILIDCVQNSLRHFLHQNAIFMCERLCAEFPSETNLQLLAGCYLHNNQAYAAYHVLKGTQMAPSRYLFARSCFQMDLLSEAEASLSPVTDPTAEVLLRVTLHDKLLFCQMYYILWLEDFTSYGWLLKCAKWMNEDTCSLVFILFDPAHIRFWVTGIYRLTLSLLCLPFFPKYTDRRKSAVHHFKQALSIDPLLWAAYEELCLLGATEEASAVFGEVAALCIQKQQLNKALAYQNT
ncbi:hypothetical protein RHGRI_011534 [Rhododendron griersonianum]|uniref:Uncharacterized protein n=1 Tax=Rhododendron griersonianum TaxID=479676 RepID=A0AAV6KMI4_9ERIC|nr:hypothetical protein RHGRI_011534 [Rhododendron griersonianum]